MAASTVSVANGVNSVSQWRGKVMLGELPGDFLRLGGTVGNGDDTRVAPNMYQQQMHYSMQCQQQRQQQNANMFMGRLNITVSQAQLAKNYGMTRMDPYCRIRVGHAVYETPTEYNGAKNPRWNKTLQCMLQHGVTTVFIEIFDERSFTSDNRVAWAHVTIPENVLSKGETIDDWFPLTGHQGDGKEGMVNFIMSLTPIGECQSPMTTPIVYQQMYNPVPAMVPATGMPIYVSQQPPPVPQTGAPQPLRPGQYPTPLPPSHTEKDVKMIQELFPSMGVDVITSVLVANGGNKDMAINSLLSMSTEST